MSIFGWFKKKSTVKDEPETKSVHQNFNYIGVRGLDLCVTNDVRNTVQKITENVDSIYNEGKTNYINGIKKSLFEGVNGWIANDTHRFFTLFGHMGTGKSFFAAKLYDQIRESVPNVVYYSAQKAYSSTTVLKNMLYTVAYKLIQTNDRALADYLSSHDLPTEIDALTEDIFIKAFEGSTEGGTFVFILDGLDEYARDDCAVFLNALKSRKHRIRSNVKIFFTGRPETYITTYLGSQDTDYYDIEEHSENSREDCAEYIRTMCERKNVSLSDVCRDMLIAKSQYSLNYIDFFLEEHRNLGMLDDPCTVDNAPSSIYGYYTEQLKKYFTEAGKLGFYKEHVKPLISVMAVSKYPLTEDETCAVLGISKTKLSDIVRDSTPLFIKRGNKVLLYHDAMKDYFVSPSCPDEYRIHKEDGDEIITKSISNLLARRRFMLCDYVRDYGHEHIIASLENNPYDCDCWDTLLTLLTKYNTAFSVTDKVCEGILEKGESFLEGFFSELAEKEIGSVAKDRIFTRMLAVSFNAPKLRDAYIAVMKRLGASPDFAFYDKLARCRFAHFVDGDFAAASAYAKEALCYAQIPSDEHLSLCRKMFCYDELIRNGMKNPSDTDGILSAFKNCFYAARRLISELLMEGELIINFKRDLSIICGRLGRWLSLCDSTVADPEKRLEVADEAAKLLGKDSSELSLRELAVQAAKAELALCEECMEAEKFDSASRLRDIIAPIRSLSRYYSSDEDLRDDVAAGTYISRAALSYSALIDLERDPASKAGRVWECISLIETVSNNYTLLGDDECAVVFATEAVKFVKSLEKKHLGEDYVSYYHGYAAQLVGEKIGYSVGMSDEALTFFEEAKLCYRTALKFSESTDERYSSAEALTNGVMASIYTELDMHTEAINYRILAIEQLGALIDSGAELSYRILDEYDAERVKLALNKTYSPIEGESDAAIANELLSALDSLLLSYGKHRGKTAEAAIPMGYICASIFAAKVNSEQLNRTLSDLNARLAALGLLEHIGGKHEKAFKASFAAELAIKQECDPDTVAMRYLEAIAEYKNTSDASDSEDMHSFSATCYREISDNYRRNDDWQGAKKYSALEIGELLELVNAGLDSEHMLELADCYYRYAVILEYCSQDEPETEEKRNTVVGFYLSALRMALEYSGAGNSQPDFAATVISDCREQLLGIIIDDYNAVGELSESGEDAEEEIAMHAEWGLKLAEELLPFVTEDVAAGVRNIIKYFESYTAHP